LHRGDAQLRDQFAGRQQCAQRRQHGADAGQGQRNLHPARAVGHDQPDAGALTDADRDERRGDVASGCVEVVVVDPGARVDHRRLATVPCRLISEQCVNGRRVLRPFRHRTPA
jgi:hypothetical protein